ncbi:hypothetical protein BJ912DRAFT_215362 [Pholiota molesta]|nr:hypothetical protein BJ912DRAFT_215362 [Pholiota molesta]
MLIADQQRQTRPGPPFSLTDVGLSDRQRCCPISAQAAARVPLTPESATHSHLFLHFCSRARVNLLPMTLLGGLFSRKHKASSRSTAEDHAASEHSTAASDHDSSLSSPTTSSYVTPNRSIPSNPNANSLLHPDSARRDYPYSGQNAPPAMSSPAMSTSTTASGSSRLRLFGRKKTAVADAYPPTTPAPPRRSFQTAPRPEQGRTSTEVEGTDIRRLRPPPPGLPYSQHMATRIALFLHVLYPLTLLIRHLQISILLPRLHCLHCLHPKSHLCLLGAKIMPMLPLLQHLRRPRLTLRPSTHIQILLARPIVQKLVSHSIFDLSAIYDLHRLPDPMFHSRHLYLDRDRVARVSTPTRPSASQLPPSGRPKPDAVRRARHHPLSDQRAPHFIR